MMTSPLPHEIRWNDARHAGRILASLDSFPPGTTERWLHLLRSSVELLNARVGVMLKATLSQEGPPRLTVIASWGWLDDKQLKLFQQDVGEHLYRENPFLLDFAQVARQAGDALACTRRELTTDERWYGSPYIQTTFKTLDIDDAILGSAPCATPQNQLWLGFLRAWGDACQFARREQGLASLLADWVSVLLNNPPPTPVEGQRAYSAAPASPTVALPKRLREVHALLLRGLAEKQVAHHLHLSPATVHRHVNRLYRTLGVNSRSELFVRAMRNRPQPVEDMGPLTDNC